MTPTVVFISRHTLTDGQRKDFIGYRIVQTRYRAESVHKLWLNVVLESGCAPEVLCVTVPWAWQSFFCKHVQRMSPHTIIIRALTESDNITPTGRYLRYRHVYGKGLVFEDYQPPRVQLLNGRKAE